MTKLYKWICSGIIIGFCGQTFSATTTLFGEAYMSAKPDQLELAIRVNSECYANLDNLIDDNNKITNKLVQFLEKNLDSQKNKVQTLGGFTNFQPSFVSHHQTKQPCANTFRKNTQIKIIIQDLESFADFFNELQNQAIKLSDNKREPGNSISYIQLNEPVQSLSALQTQAIEADLLNAALDNAKNKLKALYKDTPDDLKIESVTEQGSNNMQPHTRAMHSLEQSSSIPIKFGELNFSQNLTVKFSHNSVN